MSRRFPGSGRQSWFVRTVSAAGCRFPLLLLAGVGGNLPLMLCAGAADSAGEPPPGRGVRVPLGRLRTIRSVLMGRFVAPRRGIVLTRVGYGDPLEDTSLYGGFYLAAASLAFRVRSQTADAALCRQLLAGLLLNASGCDPGYLARGVAADLKIRRGDPSVDQYTGAFYGLALYCMDGPALPHEKKQIAGLIEAMLQRFERDGWDITRAGGKQRTTFGRLSAVQPTRAERLLAFLATGAALTGNTHWQDCFRRLWPEREQALHGYRRYDSWVLIQTAAALDLLRRFDATPEHRAVVDAACREVAAVCLPQMQGWEQFRRDARTPRMKLRDRPFALRTVRIPVEAAAVVMMVGSREQAAQALEGLLDMTARLPVRSLDYSPPLVSLELAWWAAAARGLLVPPGSKSSR